MPSHKNPSKPASASKKTAAWLFALGGIATLLYSGKEGYERYQAENPPPLQHVIAPIPEDKVETVQKGMQIFVPMYLGLNAEQKATVDQVWKTPPRSVEEVIQYLDRTHAVMSPEQRSKFKPLRTRFQEQVIDQIMEPASQGISKDDFEKLKAEVKKRVEERIDGGGQ